MRYLLTAAFVGLSFFSFSQTDSAQFFLQKGLEEKGKGRLMESFKSFDKAYNYNKADKQIVSELATALFNLRQYAPARTMYMELEKLGDQSADNYKQLMTISFNLRQFPDAIKYANLLKKTDPSQMVSYYIGKAHYDDDNFGEAIKFLSVAQKEEPQRGEIPYMIARSYADMMNYKQAIPFFEKAVSLEPTNSRWIYEIGLIYYAMHEDKLSLKYILDAAEKGYKRDNDYLENLGIAYLNVGQTDQGLSILKEALMRRPSDMNLLNMIAEANYDAKRYQEAIDYWDKVLTLDKQNASALFMIGMSYQNKGEKQKGMDLCDKAIQLDPSLAKNKQKIQMPGM
ncbi:MAG: CDC27 family protein [Chitinophagaceae bacterium]